MNAINSELLSFIASTRNRDQGKFAPENQSEQSAAAVATLDRFQENEDRHADHFHAAGSIDYHQGEVKLLIAERAIADEVHAVNTHVRSIIVDFDSDYDGGSITFLSAQDNAGIEIDFDDSDRLQELFSTYGECFSNYDTLKNRYVRIGEFGDKFEIPVGFGDHVDAYTAEIKHLDAIAGDIEVLRTTAAVGLLREISTGKNPDAAGVLVIGDRIDAITDKDGEILWSFSTASLESPDGYELNKDLSQMLNTAANHIAPAHLKKITLHEDTEGQVIWF